MCLISLRASLQSWDSCTDSDRCSVVDFLHITFPCHPSTLSLSWHFSCSLRCLVFVYFTLLSPTSCPTQNPQVFHLFTQGVSSFSALRLRWSDFSPFFILENNFPTIFYFFLLLRYHQHSCWLESTLLFCLCDVNNEIEWSEWMFSCRTQNRLTNLCAVEPSML